MVPNHYSVQHQKSRILCRLKKNSQKAFKRLKLKWKLVFPLSAYIECAIQPSNKLVLYENYKNANDSLMIYYYQCQCIMIRIIFCINDLLLSVLVYNGKDHFLYFDFYSYIISSIVLYSIFFYNYCQVSYMDTLVFCFFL